MKCRGWTRLFRYRISDNYTRFYIKYIAPNRELIDKGLYRFSDMEQLPGWPSILGLQFESLVLNNIAGLLRPLRKNLAGERGRGIWYN